MDNKKVSEEVVILVKLNANGEPKGMALRSSRGIDLYRVIPMGYTEIKHFMERLGGDGIIGTDTE